MFSVLLFSYVINAIDRQLFSVLATDVRAALGLTLPQIGLASTVFTLGMGLAGIPTGYLLGKVSRKSVTLTGLMVFSAATWLTAWSKGLPDLLTWRFISGLGEAMQLTALLAIGTSYFVRHRAVAAASLNFTFGIGAIIGPNLGAAILEVTHWKVPFIVFGLSGIVVVALIAPLVRPWFSEAKTLPNSSRNPQDLERLTVDISLWTRTPVMLAIATAFTGLSIYGYLGLYPTYLREALGFTSRQAAAAVSFYGLGALLSLAGGWMGDRYDYRKLLFFSLLVSALAGGLLFTELSRSPTVHAAMSFIFGATISGMVYANLSAGIIKSVSQVRAAEASGLFVASLYIPAAFAGYLLGQLKESMDWMLAGVIQVSGCALLAALMAITAGRPAHHNGLAASSTR
ncbi:TPA: MFS transporter [Salmonella enterica]|uniref:MFS transporter n=1 Tax=Salmonella enterica TaxID=28901 RepID=A0A744HEL4_SALER|nr:MFS transporter [Salmonella enterica]HAF4919994.1 MFS transporter [Salmonella enterica]